MGKKYNYIKKGKTPDVRTIQVLTGACPSEIEKVIERNVERFQRSHTVELAEDLPELNRMTEEYHTWLTESLSNLSAHLKTLEENNSLTSSEKEIIVKRTLKEVRKALESYIPDGEFPKTFLDIFEMQKHESLIHFDAFSDYYFKELGKDDKNYTKGYLHTLLSADYIFSRENSEKYSLLIFLSFYEAYVKRIIGMAFIEYTRNHTIEEEWADEKWAEMIRNYAENVKLPDAKSCYFTELQRWFKGDISEIVKRLLILTLPKDEYEDFYQKRSLVEKKKLRSEGCNGIPQPPIEILSPPLIEQFFLLRDSSYTNLISFSN